MRVGLMQESALRLMTLVMHLISGIVPGQDVFRKIIYAGELSVVANRKEERRKTLQE